MNKHHRTTLFAVFAAFAILLSPLGLLADNHEPAGNLARLWTFVPKSGQEDAFLKAFTKHVQWRRDHKDPWHWNVYVTDDGPDLGAYHARSPFHSWADFDAYEASEFSAKAIEHWNANVAPFLESVTTEITEYLPDISQWAEESPDYRLFQLVINVIKPGQAPQYDAAAGEITKILKAAGWKYDWAINKRISGGEAPMRTLVLPSVNWAGMADPDPNFWQVLVGAVGEEQAGKIMSDMHSTIVRQEVVTVRLLPELGVHVAK